MTKTGYSVLTGLFLMLLSACSSAPEVEIPEEIASLENLTVIPADVQPQNDINFLKEATYGETEEIILGRIVGVGVDRQGRVFIADFDQNSIHVFDPEGNYLTRLGSEGEGPGEFGNISRLLTGSDYVYAYDWSQRRINAFSLETLRFSHTISLMREDRNVEELSGAFPGSYYLRNDGTFLVSFSQPFSPGNLDVERNNIFYILDDEGRVVSDQIFEHRMADFLLDESGGGFMVMTSPFGGRPLFDTASDDRIFSAWTEDFLIRIYSPEGEYERAIYYPYTRTPLDRAEVINRYEGDRQRRMVRNADAPANWPSLQNMKLDDENRIWVAAIVEDQEVYDWWVLNEEGSVLTRFTWPRNRSIQEISNGYIYVQETDEETGLQEIVRYRFDLST